MLRVTIREVEPNKERRGELQRSLALATLCKVQRLTPVAHLERFSCRQVWEKCEAMREGMADKYPSIDQYPSIDT